MYEVLQENIESKSKQKYKSRCECNGISDNYSNVIGQDSFEKNKNKIQPEIDGKNIDKSKKKLDVTGHS